jgi:hypothetical protein
MRHNGGVQVTYIPDVGIVLCQQRGYRLELCKRVSRCQHRDRAVYLRRYGYCPVCLIQVVTPRNTDPTCCSYKYIEEVVVMRHHSGHKHHVAVRHTCVPRVGGDVYHRFCSERRNGFLFQSNLPLLFLYTIRLLFNWEVQSILRVIWIYDSTLLHSWMGQLVLSVIAVAIMWYLMHGLEFR